MHKISGRFKVRNIKSKTNTRLFKDLKVGDEILITYDVDFEYKGYAMHTSELHVSIVSNNNNASTEEYLYVTFYATEVSRMFRINFDFEQVKE